jgi:hypothetical protein
MSDNQPILSVVPQGEPEDGPWGFKRFPAMEREMAIKAAKRRKVTVPDLVAEAIRKLVESEREEAGGAYDVFPPGQALVTTGDEPQREQNPLSIAEIGQAVDIALRIAQAVETAPRRALALRLRTQ